MLRRTVAGPGHGRRCRTRSDSDRDRSSLTRRKRRQRPLSAVVRSQLRAEGDGLRHRSQLRRHRHRHRHRHGRRSRRRLLGFEGTVDRVEIGVAEPEPTLQLAQQSGESVKFGLGTLVAQVPFDPTSSARAHAERSSALGLAGDPLAFDTTLATGRARLRPIAARFAVDAAAHISVITAVKRTHPSHDSVGLEMRLRLAPGSPPSVGGTEPERPSSVLDDRRG